MRKNYWAIKHDMSRTKLYRKWKDMKCRCLNPNSCNYKHYGGKGITVCEEWMDFPTFAKWALENGYSEELTIDRIDPNGNYEPNNCRWVDWYMQNTHLTHPIPPSGYYGISKHNNTDTWYGRVKDHKKTICTGSAETPLEAAKLRESYIIEHNLPNKLNYVL